MKQFFDFILALVLVLMLSWFIFVLWLITVIDSRSSGFFLHVRIGQYGKAFMVFKIKTIYQKSKYISNIGKFYRKYKLDELPQLFNILLGKMSFVGPRPDVMKYYNILNEEEKNILKMKPGLTSNASLKYFDEEKILASQSNPSVYYDKVIFPDKVKMNLDYYYNNSFLGDIKIIFRTIFRYIK